MSYFKEGHVRVKTGKYVYLDTAGTIGISYDGSNIYIDGVSWSTVSGVNNDLATTSGVLQVSIDTNASDISTNATAISNNTDMIILTSGTLQTQVDAKPDTLLELTDTPGSYSDGLYLKSTAAGTEWATASGGGGGDVTKWTTVTVSGAGTTTITTGNFGTTYVSIGTTAGQTRLFTLPSVDSGDLGAHFRFVKTSTGIVTISGADSDVIVDSVPGGLIATISGVETYANIGLQLATEALWISTGGHGHWATT